MGKITTLPLPSISPAAPLCLSNANLFPFVKWVGFSFPDKFERKKSHREIEEKSYQTIQDHVHTCTM